MGEVSQIRELQQGLSNAQHHLRLEETSRQPRGAAIFVPSLVVVRPLLRPNYWCIRQLVQLGESHKKIQSLWKMGEQQAERLHWRCIRDLQECWSCAQRQKLCCCRSRENSRSWGGKISLLFCLLPAVLSLPLLWASSINWLNGQKSTQGMKEAFASRRDWRDSNECSKGSLWGRGGDTGGAVPSVCARGRFCSMDKAQESIPRDSRWVKPGEARTITDQRCEDEAENMRAAQSQCPICAGTEHKDSTTCRDSSGTLSHFPAIHGLKASWVRHHAFVFCGPWHAFLLEIYFSCLWTHESFGMVIDKRSLDEKNHNDIKTDLAGFLRYDEKFM